LGQILLLNYGTLKNGDKIHMNKTFYPEKYDMVVCPFCKAKGFIINPKRQCCQKCGGFGFIKKENETEED
jgi:DnaJ-class molecular chaperone